MVIATLAIAPAMVGIHGYSHMGSQRQQWLVYMIIATITWAHSASNDWYFIIDY